MAIKIRCQLTKEVSVENVGCVLKVRSFEAIRNLSDTLDYTDRQMVKVTEAFVYFGRIVPPSKRGYIWIGNRTFKTGEQIPPHFRFSWEDCSNLFVWRGSEHRTPEVDADIESNAEMREDLAVYEEIIAERTRVAEEQIAKREAEENKRKLEEERNRPEKGKKMIVAKGRKVPVGFVGTVAYISGSGGVLLKADHEWQERNAHGTWVNASNLKAR